MVLNFIKVSIFSTVILGILRKNTTILTKEMSFVCPTLQKHYQPGMHSIAYVVIDTEDKAKNLAHGIVNNKLAACVNIIPKIVSVYEWEGSIHEDPEVMMMIKTRTSKIDELTEYVKKNHPYIVCEVISVPIQNGNDAYLKWLEDVVPKSNCN